MLHTHTSDGSVPFEANVVKAGAAREWSGAKRIKKHVRVAHTNQLGRFTPGVSLNRQNLAVDERQKLVDMQCELLIRVLCMSTIPDNLSSMTFILSRMPSAC